MNNEEIIIQLLTEIRDSLKKPEKKSIKRFVNPELSEVQNYIIEQKFKVDAQAFINFYSSKGWMVGKNKMKDWKAAVRTWGKNSKGENNGQQTITSRAKQHQDKLREIAERDIEQNGYTPFLD